MKAVLNYLFEHKTLTKAEAKEVLTNMATGKYQHSEIAAFISVYLMRSITVDELSGFRDALLELCIPVDLNGFDTIDLCGTGGDGKNTFNISTITSFVVAGAGGKVAKHGNYGVSSSCGSSNVMEYLGYKFSNDPARLRHEMETCGICFIHAPLFNPAMKNVAPVRKELKVKTFFNMLGPMVNPCFPKKQMVGVYSLELARLYNYLYQQTDKQFAIIHSLDGYDEVSLTGPFKVITNTMDSILSPGDLGMNILKKEEIGGGNTIPEADDIFVKILEGRGTPAQTQVVIANATLALSC
ncbi:MAG TPA: anthranilate phosphoribosyltransferase, partial [Bacteroidales bacterium]|nr:anthranilate phosphoribosyltransferase [Bacteroidales bacterium]